MDVSTSRGFALAMCAGFAVIGCAAGAPSSRNAGAAALTELPPALLVGSDGRATDVRTFAAAAPFTVFVFFSPGCHCLSAHEPRLRALYDAYRPRGVQFAAIGLRGARVTGARRG
jgi:hypothetical protein